MNNQENKALLVARVSDIVQRKALPAQKKKLESYAIRMGWIKDKDYTYVEYDETAFKEDRRKFQELVIKPLQNQKSLTFVVFDKIDRFSRDSTSDERAALTKLFREGRIELHFPSDNLYIHKGSPASDLFRLDIGVALAGYYSSAIRDNVKRRFDQLLGEGVWVHRAPVGYKNVNVGTDVKPIKDIIVDDERAHYIVKAFELRAQGIPYAIIAKEIMESGYTSRKTGKNKITKSDIEKIINNKFYYGIMTHNSLEYKHKYKPLIDRALYNRCQLVKDTRKSMKTKYNSKDFTLKGIVTCGKCGRAVSPFRSRNSVYLRCANSLCKNPNTAESLVMGSIEAAIKQISIDENVIDKVVVELGAKHDDQQMYYNQSIETVRKEYDSIVKRLSMFFDQLVEGRITPEQHDKIVDKLTSRQDELNEQLESLTSGNKDFLITSSYLLDLASRAEELFKCSDNKLRSELVGFLLSNIQLNDKKLSFTVNYPFSAMGVSKEKEPEGSKSILWCRIADALQTTDSSHLDFHKLDKLVQTFNLSGGNIN